MAQGKGHGNLHKDLFVILKGKDTQEKRLKKMLRTEAEVLVHEGQAEFCNREQARKILSKVKKKKEPEPVIVEEEFVEVEESPKKKKQKKKK